jgi:transcriptional regulator with XRE-family HTH domain
MLYLIAPTALRPQYATLIEGDGGFSQELYADIFLIFVVYLVTVQLLYCITCSRYTFMILGEKIKFVRQQKKMSQIELAKAAGVHQKNISKYENDGVVPSAMVLKGIADALGATADYLLGSDEGDAIKDSVLLKYFKEVDNPEELKSALLTVIEAYVQNFKTKQAFA